MNQEEAYKDYVARFRDMHPGVEPLSFQQYLDAYRRWPSEYDRAWETGDWQALNDLKFWLAL